MNKIMRIGGKYTDNNANEYVKGVSVNSDGKINIIRNNETEEIKIFDSVTPTTATTLPFYGNNAIDLSEWTTCWIAVENHLDVDATIRLFSQSNKSSSAYLKNVDNKAVSIPLRHTSSGQIIITPDDYPILNYLRYFSGGIYFETAPTQGTLSLSLFRKR